jgi:hypothetical protein
MLFASCVVAVCHADKVLTLVHVKESKVRCCRPVVTAALNVVISSTCDHLAVDSLE